MSAAAPFVTDPPASKRTPVCPRAEVPKGTIVPKFLTVPDAPATSNYQSLTELSSAQWTVGSHGNALPAVHMAERFVDPAWSFTLGWSYCMLVLSVTHAKSQIKLHLLQGTTGPSSYLQS